MLRATLEEFTLPADHPIRLLPGYARLKQYTFVHDILYIQNNNPAIVVGAFSERTIESRVHTGYRDAEASPRRELRHGLLRSSAEPATPAGSGLATDPALAMRVSRRPGRQKSENH